MKDKKCALRAYLKEALAGQSDKERCEADERIAARVLALPEYQAAQCIFLYISVGLEVNTGPILCDAFAKGKRVCVPRCLEHGIMEAIELSSPAALVPGRYGIPSAPETAAVVPPEWIDFMLVPGLGFDCEGRRLGRGGGYYDRYLKRISEQTVTVGICRRVQCVDCVPCEETDHRVEKVIME